jgi:ubiquinone/menaquinone biosynthesis C-methylase UbiE
MSRRAKQLTRRLKPWISTGGRIADVGSGTGHNAETWRQDLDVIVDEFDVQDLHWIGDGPMIFDGRKIPAPDAAYSTVTLLFVLQYAVDPVGLLQELRRMSAGRVLLVQSTYQGTWGYFWLSVREFFWGPVAHRVARVAGIVKGQSCSLKSRTLYTRQQLARMFQQAGLTVIHSQAEPWWGRSTSRDLYVLESATRPSTCRSSSPPETKSDGWLPH